MITRKSFPFVLWIVSFSASANLQPRDVLFFSTHKRPVQVVSDDRQAFVLTENGILMYDYRRAAWVDNVHEGLEGRNIEGIFLPADRGMLWVKVGGKFLEYNPTFERFTDAGGRLPAGELGLGRAADLTGLILRNEYFFLGDAIRDRYMRRAPVTQARVFAYDNLWVLTGGLGPFLGSGRRRDASSAWFGLDQPEVLALYAHEGELWFGSCDVEGGVVHAREDLSEWRLLLARRENGFPHGCVHDFAAWKGAVWFASENGVVRHEPGTTKFRHFGLFQGATGVRINRLHVHRGALTAATDQGISTMRDPEEGFMTVPPPQGVTVSVKALASNGEDLLAGTEYGLYVSRGGEWKALKDLAGGSAPYSYGVDIPDLHYGDRTLYWLAENRVVAKPAGRGAKVLMERDRPNRLSLLDPFLFVSFRSGVTAYNLESGLWTDFRLEDGIPGTRVLTFLVDGEFLWIATDAGVTRIRLRSYAP